MLSNSLISQYAFDIDYESYYACLNGSGCCDGDYCRCGVIDVAGATIGVDPNSVLQQILENHVYTADFNVNWDILNYCAGRLFVHYKLYDSASYEIVAEPGYYGEELEGVLCDKLPAFLEDYYALSVLSEGDMIRYVLKQEYKTLLPGLETASFEIKEIALNEIEVPRDYRRIDGPASVFHSFPIGIYKKKFDKYQIIDGHHRWADFYTGDSLEEAKTKIICVV
jgi:hypothetical protein